MSNNPKRHHHLAQTIQRNFLEAGDTKLWWYSRALDRYEERTPYGIAHGKNTYTFSNVEGEDRYALELAFSKVEDKAGPAFKKLAASLNLTQMERNAISEFVGFQFLRTPSKIEMLQKIRDVGGAQIVDGFAAHVKRMTPNEFAAYINQYEAKTGKTMALSQKDLVTSLKTRPPKVTSTKEGTLESLVELGTDLTVEYSKRTWTVLHAPQGSSFITSSEGVFLASDRHRSDPHAGPKSPGMSTIFPFSRHAVLVIEASGPPAIEHAQTDELTVATVNDGLARISGEIYGSPRPLLEAIVKRNELATTQFEIHVHENRLRETFSKHIEKNADEAFPRTE